MRLFANKEGHTLSRPKPEPQLSVMERTKEKILTVPQHDPEALTAEISRLAELRYDLLGVEVRAKTEIDHNVKRLTALLKREELREAIGDLPRVDPVVLTWRRDAKFFNHTIAVPELALYSLENPTLKLAVEWHSARGDWSPELPPFVAKAYQDVVDQVYRTIKYEDRQSLELSTTYDGIIPAETKEKIRDAQKTFEDVRLLGEATKWSARISPYRVDPIVVGIAANEMWVIDVFDPTPVEEYVASEFTF